MEHRREIDGLRALAVVPVILFHAGMDTFSGGFVGVDVFFVISGYLITSIILGAQQKGTFTLANFYERRARRILPALFLVMFACLLPAWFLLIPQDLKLFSQSLAAVTVFASNVLFYTANDYFDVASEFSPLLHTWSLAVEEQYYVLFPLFMMLAWRFARRWIVHAIAAGLLVSLAVSEWGLNGHRAFTFYMLPTRGWELMIGALLAFAPPLRHGARDWQVELAALAGMAMIVAAILMYDASTPFPGFSALLPTLGTALVIRYAVAGTLAGRLLSLPLFVGIGLISYSAYLWHQPLLAFARHAFGGELALPLSAGAVLLTFLFAWLSWRYVETPFRDRQRVATRTLVISAASCAILFISLGLLGHVNNGFDQRLSAQERAVAAWSTYEIDALYRRHTCFLQATESDIFAPECDGGGSPDVFVWGDSYAAALAAGLRETVRVAQYTGSGCPPMADYTLKRPPACASINRTASAQVRALKPALVILHANWLRYPWLDAEEDLASTLDGLRRDLPGTRVLVLGVVPQWSPSLPITLIRAGAALDAELELPLLDMPRRRALDERLRAVADAHGAQFVPALDAFCTGERCAAVLRDGAAFAPIAWDNGHLTLAGSRHLAAALPLSAAVMQP
jgi:peptidoglycan/LPS O-acetylase OafA/YrhL